MQTSWVFHLIPQASWTPPGLRKTFGCRHQATVMTPCLQRRHRPGRNRHQATWFDLQKLFLGAKSMIWNRMRQFHNKHSFKDKKITLKSHKLKLSSRAIIGRNPPTSGIPRLYHEPLQQNNLNKYVIPNSPSLPSIFFINTKYPIGSLKNLDPEKWWFVKITFLFCGMAISYIPSRELTYPPDMAYLKMIFLFPRWDMLNCQAANLHFQIPQRLPHGPFPTRSQRLERSGAKKGRSSQGLGLVRCGTMHRLDHLEGFKSI